MWFALLLTNIKRIALIAGLLFALHPMHVESIAWAAERKDLLYALFFFASLIAYLHYLKNTGNKLNYFFCFLFFALSIFSKAMAACLPPVLVLTDLYYRRKYNFKLVLEKLPFFILAFILGAVSVYASGKDGSINTNTTYSIFDRIILANANLLLYAVKLIIPFHLSAFYPYPDKINGMLPWYYFAAPVIVLIIAALVIYYMRRNRNLFFYTGFFTLTLLLVLQLLPVGPTVFSERYSYIPSAALFIFAGVLTDTFLEKNKKNQYLMYLLYAGIGVYSIWLSVITFERCKTWKNPETFWSDVIVKFDNVPIAYNNRGHYYNKNGKKQEAMADFNKAISLNATYDMALFNRGSLFGEMNKFDEALQDLNLAIKINPKLPEAYKMRGQVYAVTGKGDAAMSDFKKALELQPDFAEIYFNMGIFYFNAGNKEEACKSFIKADQYHFDKAKAMIDRYCR